MKGMSAMLKHVARTTLAALVAVLLAAPMFPAAADNGVETSRGGASRATSNAPADYVPPKHEEGKINLNGYYLVGGDGQLTQELEWTFPYVNPLMPDEGNPDPGRPYKYRIWQSKKSATADEWSAWETRSPVDVDEADGQVRVLNVYPTAAAKDNIKTWMESTEVTDYDGSKTTVGRGIIKVTPVSIDDFNANPDKYLKTDPDTGELTQDYQYSVAVFGTADSNGSKDLSTAAADATERFADAGGGLLFGHDTVYNARVGFKRFGGERFLNFEFSNAAAAVIHRSTYVKVTDTGFLTSRPWNLEGKTLQIPEAHSLSGTTVGGQNADGSVRNRVWMQFSDSAGAVFGAQITPGSATTSDNYYLATNGSTAMIQTGHSNGAATEDEMKVIANTIIYLAQSTTTTHGRDITFRDEDAPSPAASGAVSQVDVAADARTYQATLSLSGSVDKGTDYAYRIQAIPQITLADMTDYNEVWSSTATDPDDPSVYRQTALSGLRGYYVASVDESPDKRAKPDSVPTGSILSASHATDVATYRTGALNVDTQYYVHVFAVDWAGNVSDDLVVPVSMSSRTVYFHHNDGTDGIDQTLLTPENKAASWVDSLERENYRFLGWYDNPEGTGVAVTADTVFSGDEVNLYAKWLHAWQVTTAQIGSGTVSAAGPDGTAAPFDEGTDVSVTWAPDAGSVVKAVWIDGEPVADPSSGGAVISSIKANHHVVVEFAHQDADDEPVPDFLRVDTWISGGPGSITPSVVLAKDDDRADRYRVEWKVPAGYRVASVTVNGAARPDLVEKGGVTFLAIDRDQRVEVALEKDEEATERPFEVVTELVGGPGIISPSARVEKGSAYMVDAAVADERNYEVESITVYDGNGVQVNSFPTSKDATTASAQLSDIRKNYRVVVKLAPKQQPGTVTVPEEELVRVLTTCEGIGTVTPSSILRKGDDYLVEWKAADGWEFAGATVDGVTSYYPEKGEAAGSEGHLRTFDAEREGGSVNIGSPGSYPFNDVQQDRRIHVVFKRTAEEPQEDAFSVRTELVGGPGTITAGNGTVAEGSDYPVEWSVPEGYIVTSVTVNGAEDPALLDAMRYDIKGIARNYHIVVTVAKAPAPHPVISKAVVNDSRTEGNQVGDRLTYTITVRNDQPRTIWKNGFIEDRIPLGMSIDTASIRLGLQGSDAQALPVSCYDPLSRTLRVPLAPVTGDDVYVLTFSATIEQAAIQPGEGSNLTNVAVATDGEGNPVPDPDGKPAESNPTLPNDQPGATPLPGAKGSVSKTAHNLSQQGTVVQAGDRIRYSIAVSNGADGTVWTNVRVKDPIPAGLDVDTTTLVLIRPDGSSQTLDGAVYNAQTRELAVFVGDVFGGEEYRVEFEATVRDDAVGGDIGNTATAVGGKPSEEGSPGHWGSAADPGVKPGDPGFIEAGELGEGEEPLATEKQYPDGSKTVVPNPNGGISGGGDGGASGDGTSSGFGTDVYGKKLASTGDEALPFIVGATIAALVAGCFIGVARRSLVSEDRGSDA